MRHRRHLLPLLLAAAGCGATGQRELTLPVLCRGDGEGPIAAGDYTVLLDRAEVGFGPAYFCATSAAAADLCPVAVAELAASVTVDGKSAAWQPLGEIQGTTGEVRSATAIDASAGILRMVHRTHGDRVYFIGVAAGLSADAGESEMVIAFDPPLP